MIQKKYLVKWDRTRALGRNRARKKIIKLLNNLLKMGKYSDEFSEFKINVLDEFNSRNTKSYYENMSLHLLQVLEAVMAHDYEKEEYKYTSRKIKMMIEILEEKVVK